MGKSSCGRTCIFPINTAIDSQENICGREQLQKQRKFPLQSFAVYAIREYQFFPSKSIRVYGNCLNLYAV